MNALDILKYGHQAVLQSLDGLHDGAWEKPGACGVWSVKDIIAHLASFELVLVDVLVSLTNAEQTPHLTQFINLGPQFNDAEVDRRKERSTREALQEYHDAHIQVMSLAARLSPEVFARVGTLPWYGDIYSLDDFIVYTFYGHKREHSAQIALFRDHVS
jgi:Mycothiol maleylpyruvate isomerase N-terminal domain